MIETTPHGELTVILPTENVSKFIDLFLEWKGDEKNTHFGNAYLTRHEERELEQEGMSAVWVEFEYDDDIIPLLDIEEARRRIPSLCRNTITLNDAIALLGIKGFSLTGHEDGQNDPFHSSIGVFSPPRKYFEKVENETIFGEGCKPVPRSYRYKIYEIWCVDTYLEHEWCEEITTDEDEAYNDAVEWQEDIWECSEHARYHYELRKIQMEITAYGEDDYNIKEQKLSKLIDQSDLGQFYDLTTREPSDLKMIMEADDSDLLDSEEIKIKKLCLGLKKAGIEPSSCECYDIKSSSKIIDEREEAEHMGETQEMRDEEKACLLLDDPFRFEMD